MNQTYGSVRLPITSSQNPAGQNNPGESFDVFNPVDGNVIARRGTRMDCFEFIGDNPCLDYERTEFGS